MTYDRDLLAYCPSCGQLYPAPEERQWGKCEQCRTEAEPEECPQCGAVLDRCFCQRCGFRSCS